MSVPKPYTQCHVKVVLVTVTEDSRSLPTSNGHFVVTVGLLSL